MHNFWIGIMITQVIIITIIIYAYHGLASEVTRHYAVHTVTDSIILFGV